jgi:hypothetical protein
LVEQRDTALQLQLDASRTEPLDARPADVCDEARTLEYRVLTQLGLLNNQELSQA